MTLGVTEQFFKSVEKSQSIPFLNYAVSASGNADARSAQVDSLIGTARGLHSEIVTLANKLNGDYSLVIPKTKEFHYCILGIVEKLTVLVETFFASLAVVKKDFRKLPFAVLQQIKLGPERQWAKRRPRRDISKVFLFPRARQIFSSPEARRTLRRSSKAAVDRIAQGLYDLESYYGRYVQIFNKCKHTISEQVGYTEIVESQSAKYLRTMIFFEDYPPPKRRRHARRRPTTWGIIAGPEVIDYLEAINKTVVALHKLLLVTRLDYLHNAGRPFIPAFGHFLTNAELSDLSHCVDQERTFRSIGQISWRTNWQWDPAVRQKAEDIARRRNWVFRISRHVFSGKKAVKFGNLTGETA